jgi:hypothetical protein
MGGCTWVEAGVGVWEIPASATQFYYESKTALKKMSKKCPFPKMN